jgi:hypothetical protein
MIPLFSEFSPSSAFLDQAMMWIHVSLARQGFRGSSSLYFIYSWPQLLLFHAPFSKPMGIILYVPLLSSAVH